MNDELKVVIEEKFTRCPQCRSFSMRQTDELTFEEKLKARWVSTVAFKCDNCSYRYVEFGSFSDTVKGSIKSLYERINKKWLYIGVPIIIVLIAVTLISVIGLERGPRIRTVKKDQPDIKMTQKQTGAIPAKETPKETPKETQKTTDQQTGTVTTPKETPKENPEPVIRDIILGNSNRYGVNWVTVSNGVQIAKMSEGPLKTAGLDIGDVVREVDDRKVSNGDYLLKVRNDIANRKRDEAILKVYRNGQLFLYRLIKEKKEKKIEKSGDQGIANKDAKTKDVKPKDINIQPPVPTKTVVSAPVSSPQALEKSAQSDQSSQKYSIQVFSQSIVKIRSSSPSSSNPANKWKYSQKSISVKREANQRVYIAGDPAGLKKWGADDQLIINGTVFSGIISDDYRSVNSFIPEDVKTIPLEITELVPPGKNVQLNIALTDHGKLWGNTDIYIVIK